MKPKKIKRKYTKRLMCECCDKRFNIDKAMERHHALFFGQKPSKNYIAWIRHNKRVARDKMGCHLCWRHFRYGSDGY